MLRTQIKFEYFECVDSTKKSKCCNSDDKYINNIYFHLHGWWTNFFLLSSSPHWKKEQDIQLFCGIFWRIHTFSSAVLNSSRKNNKNAVILYLFMASFIFEIFIRVCMCFFFQSFFFFFFVIVVVWTFIV